MTFVLGLLLLAQILVLVAAEGPYAGFSYGAFWTDQTAKTEADFVRQFNRAKSLQTPVSFNSARLFTCIQWKTANDPIEAFGAAIQTNTTLLLGLYNVGNNTVFANEVAALQKGLETHGQPLVDLIIGISVGNEDIYRQSDECKGCLWGASADVVSAKVGDFKSKFQSGGTLAKYFTKMPPIGHTDVAKNSAEVSGVDFAGATIYPFHAGNGAADAMVDFNATYNMVKKNAHEIDVWVTETGWPVAGETKKNSSPGVASLQTYWNTIGCWLISQRVNFWWFELENDTIDSTQGQPWDWAILDANAKPRITVTCPGRTDKPRAVSEPTSPPSTESSYPSPSSEPSAEHASHTGIPSSQSPQSMFYSSSPLPDQIPPSATIQSAPTVTTPPSNVVIETKGCITVGIFTDGKEHIIASNLPGPDGKCSSPPPFNPSLIPVTVTTTECVTVEAGATIAIATNPPGPDGKCAAPPPDMAAQPIPADPPASGTTLIVSVPTSHSITTAIIMSSSNDATGLMTANGPTSPAPPSYSITTIPEVSTNRPGAPPQASSEAVVGNSGSAKAAASLSSDVDTTIGFTAVSTTTIVSTVQASSR